MTLFPETTQADAASSDLLASAAPFDLGAPQQRRSSVSATAQAPVSVRRLVVRFALAGLPVLAAAIVRALRAAGSRAQIVSGDSLVTDDFGAQAKEAAERTQMTYTYDPRKSPAARSVLERMRAEERTGEGFSLYA